MSKKELQDLIQNYKPKYIYQRYNGQLRKYEVVKDNYLVDIKTGMSFDFKSHMMFGKLSDNIIELIEIGDYVNGQEVVTVYGYDEDGNDKDGLGIIEVDDFAYDVYLKDLNIKSIVTREEFEERKFIV